VQKIETPMEQVGSVNFGFTTWLDGDHLVIGAPNILFTQPGGLTGFAYIYERNIDNGSWNLVSSIAGELAEPDEFPDGKLGREVVIDSDRAMISRLNVDGTATVLIYERDSISEEWIETNALAIGGSEDGNASVDIARHYISALALHNNRLAIGVVEEGFDSVDSSAVRIFELDQSQNTWLETDRIDQFDASANGNAYHGLALENDRLLVTGDLFGALLFERDSQSGQWLQDEQFVTDVTNSISVERQASDLEGSRVVLTGVDGVGVLVYERDGVSGRWIESAELSTTFLDDNSPTVTAVDLQGDHVLVGLPYVDDFTGAVLAFRLDDPDSDGIAAVDDNCPEDYNPTQANFDEDLLGDACDLDDDNDSVPDDEDAFPLDPSRQNAVVDVDTAEAPTVPYPASPLGSGIQLETDYRWPAVSNASFYIIEVQHDNLIRAYETMIPAFTSCIDMECAYIKTDAALKGANRWRLRAGNANGISEWSLWSDFFVDQAAAPFVGNPSDHAAFSEVPAVPVPLRPVDEGNSEGVTFHWASVPGVIRYSIEVQHQGLIRGYEPSLPSIETCSMGECRYVKTDAALVGENRWRLRSINDVGASEWSDWANFTVENLH